MLIVCSFLCEKYIVYNNAHLHGLEEHSMLPHFPVPTHDKLALLDQQVGQEFTWAGAVWGRLRELHLRHLAHDAS